MNEFVSINILSTITGCSLIITLLTQVFKRYLPKKIDKKWLALIFSIIVGVLRIIYLHQFDFDSIISGVFNIFVLLATAIGIYEIGEPASDKIKTFIGGENDDKNKK